MLKKILEKCMVVIIIFCVVLVPILVQAAPAPAAFSNGSFEDLDAAGKAKGWVEYSWANVNPPDGALTTFTLMSDANAKDGKNYMKITNVVSDDSRLIYSLKVQAGDKYKVTCWVKTENVGTAKVGANISIVSNLVYSKDLKGTNDWTQLEYYFESTDSDKANLSVGIGSYGKDNTGIAYFDDVKVEKIDAFPKDAVIAKVVDESKIPPVASTTNNNSNTSTTTIIIICIVIVLVIAAIAFVIMKKKVSGTESKIEDGNLENKSDLLDESDESDQLEESDESEQTETTKLKDDDDDDDTSL